jgi:hypothetical protein
MEGGAQSPRTEQLQLALLEGVWRAKEMGSLSSRSLLLLSGLLLFALVPISKGQFHKTEIALDSEIFFFSYPGYLFGATSIPIS